MNNKKISLPRTPAEWLEAVMNFIFFLCGILAVGCVLLISVYMVLSGVPAIQKIGLFRFLFGTRWASTAADPAYGILPFILSSVYGTLGATVIGVPIGLLTAVFLSKAAGPKVRTVVVTAIELLSGIPSVVFGLLGMQVLVPAVAKTFGKASGACLLSAIVVLAVMILPSIVSVSVTALNAVPPEYEQGSLALGATDAETWFKVSVPAARSGIAADDEVDYDFNAIKHTLAQEIAADPGKVDAALDLLMVIKYLERIGDHAVNLAEWVEFVRSGRYHNENMF